MLNSAKWSHPDNTPTHIAAVRSGEQSMYEKKPQTWRFSTKVQKKKNLKNKNGVFLLRVWSKWAFMALPVSTSEVNIPCTEWMDTPPLSFLLVNNCDLCGLPYVCDGLFVFTVCGPYRYLISFGSDINHGSANIITVVIKCFTHKTQELQGREREREKHYRLVSAFSNVSVSDAT